MTVKYFSLYNVGAAGAVAGMASQKQKLYENTGAEVAPSDFADIWTAGFNYATALDLSLQTLTPSTTTNITNMVNDGATVVPNTAALADAAAVLPLVLGLMSKSAQDGRGLPRDSSGAIYSVAEWTSSLIPNWVASEFIAFCENTFPDGAGSTVKYVPLANVVFGAAIAGFMTGRANIYQANTTTPLTPSTVSAKKIACCQALAIACDSLLQTLTPSTQANVTGLVSGSSNDYSTVVPSTAAGQNALDTLTCAIGGIVKATLDARPVPLDASGSPYTEAEWIASGIPNAIVAQFLEWAENASTS